MSSINHHNIINQWHKTFDERSFEDLLLKPSPTSWSLGQLGMHLVESSRWHLKQVEICLNSDDHADGEMTSNGKAMFAQGAFPDQLIEGPPSNAVTPQPQSKEALLQLLADLQRDLEAIGKKIAVSTSRGKTKHPSLHYFNAREWFQFIDMHLRHHLRQRSRIEAFLNMQK